MTRGFDHEAPVEGWGRGPGFEKGAFEKLEGDGPEVFGDVLEGGVGWKVVGELIDGEPFSATAAGVEEVRGGWSGGVEMIEEAAVDELLGDNRFVTKFFREVVFEKAGELELVAAKAGEFSEVVVAGVGAGEGEAGFGVDGEVEFGGKFEVDQLAGDEIAEEEIEFADGGVDVGLDLEILGEEIIRGG